MFVCIYIKMKGKKLEIVKMVKEKVKTKKVVAPWLNYPSILVLAKRAIALAQLLVIDGCVFYDINFIFPIIA